MDNKPFDEMYEPISKCVSETLEDIELKRGRTGEISGLSTGSKELDRITQGLQPGDLVVVGGVGPARPSG